MAQSFRSLLERMKSIGPCESGINEALMSARLDRRELEGYIFFSDKGYTRNMIYQCPEFEILSLCWHKGSKTPIHDHPSAKGWIYMVEGELKETIYHGGFSDNTLDEGAATSTTLGKWEYSCVYDEIGVHCIENTSDQQAVSLHVYTPSIKVCNYYDEKAKEKKSYQTINYSEYGKIL